jgi:hypothetical protein
MGLQAMPGLDALHRTDADTPNLGYGRGRPGRRLARRPSLGNGGMRGGRILSRNKPATRSVLNRSWQRQTAVLLVPVRRMISAAPQPSAVGNTIRVRQERLQKCNTAYLPLWSTAIWAEDHKWLRPEIGHSHALILSSYKKCCAVYSFSPGDRI